MTDTAINIEEYESVLEELHKAEAQLLAFSKLAVKHSAQYHTTNHERISLGVGCGISLVERMALASHSELVEGPPSSIKIGKQSGHAIYGPYARLDRGRYEIAAYAGSKGNMVSAQLRLAQLSVQVVAAPSEEVRTQQKFKLGKNEKAIRIEFDVGSSDQTFEFRISSNGHDLIEVTRLEIWRLA